MEATQGKLQHALVRRLSDNFVQLQYICLHVAITCDQLNDPQNGDVQQPSTATVGSVAVYNCDQGFRLDGENKRVCQFNRTYTGIAPNCVGKF